jgi:hypothetical protein
MKISKVFLALLTVTALTSSVAIACTEHPLMIKFDKLGMGLTDGTGITINRGKITTTITAYSAEKQKNIVVEEKEDEFTKGTNTSFIHGPIRCYVKIEDDTESKDKDAYVYYFTINANRIAQKISVVYRVSDTVDAKVIELTPEKDYANEILIEDQNCK